MSGSETEPYVLEAIEREADPKAWHFTFDGDDYTLPSDFDMRAMAAFTGGRLDDAFRILLGPEQWQRMQASPKTFGYSQFEALMKTYSSAIGVDLEKAQASASSSPSMPTLSKPTSPASTASDSLTSSLPAGLVRRPSSAGVA
jgi:hypothetical protein